MKIRYLSQTDDNVFRAINNMMPQPQILECHPSTMCNLNCDYCHTKWINYNFKEESIYCNSKKTLLAVSEYRKIFHDFADGGGKIIVLSGGLEPTLYPKFIELIKTISLSTLEVHLYTNGITDVFLNNISEILTHVTTVRISIHACAGNFRLQQLMDKLYYFKQISNSDLYRKLLFSVYEDFLLIDNIDCIAKLITGLNIPIFIKDYINESTANNAIEVFNLLSLYNSKNVFYLRQESGKSSACYSIYRYLVLDPFGGVHNCCMRAHLSERDFSYIGNIKELPLLDLMDRYNGKKLNKYIYRCRVCSSRDYQFNKVVKDHDFC